jgi:glycosyltransferase involved in cell wall biosynthesis
MLISVVIPTYGREQALVDSINDVLKQDYADFEVIVVDQTVRHEPDTDRFLAAMVAAGKIQLYQLDWASLPGARNYAVRRAKGDIIVFLDDDVELPAGFLAAHAVGCSIG